MKQQMLEKEVAELKEENAKLRAQIDNLQAAPPAPTIIDVLGAEAFDRMVELFPSFRESGTPTNPTDAASEVLWSCVRTLMRRDKALEYGRQVAQANAADLIELREKQERAVHALAEYAMRAVEEEEA